MIKNIYKSYISTIIGVLFLLGGIAYPFYHVTSDYKIMTVFIIAGVILLFVDDKKIGKLIINSQLGALENRYVFKIRIKKL